MLREHGYYNGIIGQENHLEPREKFAWDSCVRTYDEENDWGRSPILYYGYTKEFLLEAKRAGKPFFLMANSHDPHRPFAWSEDELQVFGRHVYCERTFRPEEIEVPGFLPDIPDVRKEVAEYFTSVHRMDEMVGGTLRALWEENHENDSVVLFLSDSGMSFPYAKTNCYLNSTRSPWVLRWPGVVAAGSVSDALVSGIDYIPTVLDILGIQCPEGVDGISALPVLLGTRREMDRKHIYTQFFKTAANQITGCARLYPMRCVQDKRYAYIFNAWAGGGEEFRNESMSSLTFQAMTKAAETDPAIAARVEFYLNRTREELYDYVEDPDALCNLIREDAFAGLAVRMRSRMFAFMRESGDPLIEAYEEACGE